MRRILIYMTLLTSCCQTVCPDVIRIEGEKLHVQGIALDKRNGCVYSSFTSAFFKSDLEGNLIGSITGINGHLGALTLDEKSGKAYASLEIKNDAIGNGIADLLGDSRHEKSESGFYIAEIDVRKVDRRDVPFEDAVTLHHVEEAAEDYLAAVEIEGKSIAHRYGCSGIDGIAIAPGFGDKAKGRFLYVAYGIYGDSSRSDNDYNIILCYSLADLSRPVHKYFIHTGNTRYGIQNMAYDRHTGKMYLAVYKGEKPEYPNYSMFTLDMEQNPFEGRLIGVPYETGNVEQLKVSEGSHFRWGSTGMCPLGDGRWYISEHGTQGGRQYCNMTLYGSSEEFMLEKPTDCAFRQNQDNL